MHGQKTGTFTCQQCLRMEWVIFQLHNQHPTNKDFRYCKQQLISDPNIVFLCFCCFPGFEGEEILQWSWNLSSCPSVTEPPTEDIWSLYIRNDPLLCTGKWQGCLHPWTARNDRRIGFKSGHHKEDNCSIIPLILGLAISHGWWFCITQCVRRVQPWWS